MTIYPDADEKKLLLRLRDGDSSAFEILMESYKRPLANRVLRLLKSKEDTEEVLQELFVRVWMNREKLDPQLSFKAYIFRIAENLVLDMLRQATRDRRFAAMYKSMQSDVYNPIEDQLHEQENRVLLHQILSHIPEQPRRVYMLCKLEGKSYEEVGKMLSISTATVNSHMTKANRFLREYLNKHPIKLASIVVHYLFLGLS